MAEEISPGSRVNGAPTKSVVLIGGAKASLTDQVGVSIWELYATDVAVSLTVLELSRKFGEHVSLSAGYGHLDVSPDGLKSSQEERIRSAATLRYEIGPFALETRQMFEWRFRDGPDSWRYRPKLIGNLRLGPTKLPWRLFVWEEGYYDSQLERWDISLLSAGFGIPLSKHLNGELSYIRQDQVGKSGIDALGISVFYTF
jgi:hypothetical protein